MATESRAAEHGRHLRFLLNLAEQVTAAAVEHPAFTYTSREGRCAYRPDPVNPYGCIVGHALRGVGYQHVDDLDDSGAIDVLELTVWPEMEDQYPLIDTDRSAKSIWSDIQYVLSWIDTVQDNQDHGLPWREAVGFANDDYPVVADMVAARKEAADA